MSRRFVRTIDLVDDDALIAEYEDAHRPGNVPPAVLASQRRRGVVELTIYRASNRLVMVMEVDEFFDVQGLDADAAADPTIAAWHARMGGLQQSLGGAHGWADMTPVFRQSDHP